MAITKVQLYNDIICNLFKATCFYLEHLQTGNKESKKYYRLLIKAGFLKLEKQYYATKKDLGVTGNSGYYKKEI